MSAPVDLKLYALMLAGDAAARGETSPDDIAAAHLHLAYVAGHAAGSAGTTQDDGEDLAVLTVRAFTEEMKRLRKELGGPSRRARRAQRVLRH